MDNPRDRNAIADPLTAPLTARHLNRATLARQLLLAREPLDPLTALERLAGVQAQNPHTWYVGLWARLAPFDPREAGELLTERRAVRMPLMRGAVHAVSAADAPWMRPLLRGALARPLARRAEALRGVDIGRLAAAARAILESEPHTAAELGARLAERWPGRDPEALALAARAQLGLVQVPPRGVWGRSGRPAHTTIEKWLEKPLSATAGIERLVLRYLAAFGPATPADFSAWSGLPPPERAFARLRPDLVTLVDGAGVEYLDVPDAPRPDPDAPAPARLLYAHDNLLRAHADLSRFQRPHGPPAAWTAPGPAPGAVLVDGVVRGRWAVQRRDDALELTVQRIGRISAAQRDELEAEAHGLLGMLAPSARREIHITAP